MGTTWHSAQAVGFVYVPVFRWPWCQPTARVEVAVSPFVPRGGDDSSAGSAPGSAMRVLSPWHDVQVIELVSTSMTPLMCSVLSTVCDVAEYPAPWHVEH